MSWQRRSLNLWLRLVEKRQLARAQHLGPLRTSFLRKARWLFRPPRGTRFDRISVAGRSVLCVNPGPGPLILYLHGGAFIMGAPDTHRALAGHVSKRSGLPVYLPAYRLAPEHPFPAAPDDALAVYRALSTHPEGIILGGDSAGGALALGLLADILRENLPLPRGVFAFSPLTDLSFSGESAQHNAATDVVLPINRFSEMTGRYVPDGQVTDPRVSPLFADFAGAPPVWLTAGDTEALLDDTRRMAAHLRAQDVRVTEEIRHDLPHVWPLFHDILPEARETLDDLAEWLSSLEQSTTGS